MELGHDGGVTVNHRLRCRLWEEGGDHGVHELGWRLIGQFQAPVQSRSGDLRGEGTGPTGVCGGQHQRPRDAGMSTVQLKGQRTAEREPGDVRPLKIESADDLGEAISVVSHPK